MEVGVSSNIIKSEYLELHRGNGKGEERVSPRGECKIKEEWIRKKQDFKGKKEEEAFKCHANSA